MTTTKRRKRRRDYRNISLFVLEWIVWAFPIPSDEKKTEAKVEMPIHIPVIMTRPLEYETMFMIMLLDKLQSDVELYRLLMER